MAVEEKLRRSSRPVDIEIDIEIGRGVAIPALSTADIYRRNRR
jgi:hypothetical protein